MDYFHKVVEEIVRRDERYKEEAYLFLMEALEFTREKLKRQGHISGQELLRGIKDYAREKFGFLAPTVFEYWGVTNTEDFGEIVFNMVEAGLLRRRPEDKREDFKNVYNLKEAFKQILLK